MLDMNTVQRPDSESVPEIIPLPKLTKDWTKPRSFLKDKNQLETVLGSSNENWFDELTDRAHQARNDTFKQQLPLFDSPISSPTVSQLIKNHIQVGHSPPRFYHSSPASAVKNIHEYSLLGTPDSNGKWQRPSLGISPVLKDYPSFRGRSHVVAKLGLSHNDSTLSWTNSLATPPRLDETNNESSTEAQAKYKDPVRALFSPSHTLDVTGESLQALESTYEEDYDNSVIKHEDDSQFVESIDSGEHATEIEHSIETDCKHLNRSIEVKDEKILPSEMGMDTWRESFRRKLLVKSDSFGKNRSIESISSPARSDQNCSTPIKLLHPLDEIKLEPCGDGKRKYCDSNNPVQQVLKDQCSQISESITSPKQVMDIKESLSPVFPKPASSSKKVKRSSRMKRTREITDNGVVEALSDFFDPPSGAVGKRNTPSLKRKSSEVGDIDVKPDINFTNDVFSTPKNVIISSILMKDKQTRSSSGKKVRFSESVIKYSEEKHANDSHTKKRRKTQNIPKSRNKERNSAIKIESIKKESVLSQEEDENNADIRTTVISPKCDNSDFSKHKENAIEALNEVKECEEVFSQISPTALEEMCNAAKRTCDKDGGVKTPYLECPPNNSGDFSRNSDPKFMSPHTNMKQKRFMYPSKQQIVVASPSETFKFKTDEKGDARSKGIVMAIKTDNIVTVKDIDQVNNKIEDEKMKNSVSEKTEQEVSNNKEMTNPALQKSVRYQDSGEMDSSLTNQIKDVGAVGFQCASGKGINLSEVAVAKARTLLEEDQCLALDTRMKTPPNKENKEVSKDTTLSKDMFNDEDMELADWCEDIDNDQAELVVDACLHKNVEQYVEKEQTENLSHKCVEVINQQGRTSIGSDEKVKIQSNQDSLCNNEENKAYPAFGYSKGNQNSITSEVKYIEKNASSSTQKAPPLQKDTHPFSGFTTASGHVLEFEGKELTKAKELLTFSDESLGSNNIMNIDCLANKSEFSDKSNVHAEVVCSSHEFKEDQEVVKDFGGFATASGKCLKLSTATVKSAEILLGDNNTKTEENTIKRKVPVKEQTTATLPGRKHSLSLHDMFKEELGIGKLQRFGNDSLLDDELQSLKTLKSKTESNRNVKEITEIKVNKPCTKLPDNLDKPQGFRPFKAPKITLKKTDKYPPSGNTNTVIKEVNLDKTPTLKQTISDKNSFDLKKGHLLKNTKTKNGEEVKQKETMNYSESDLVIEKNDNEISLNDVCEGIFTQMFADEMDLDETPCQHPKNLEEEEKNIKMNSSVKQITNCDNKKHNLAGSLKEALDDVLISNATKVPVLEDLTHELNSGQSLGGNKDVLSSLSSTQSQYSGFKTASGLKVVTSCDAIEKARQSFQEDETNVSSYDKKILLQKPTEDSSVAVVSSKDSKNVNIQTDSHCKNKVKCDTRYLNELEASHVIVEEIDSSIRKIDLTTVSVKKDSNKSALFVDCDDVSLPNNDIMKDLNGFCTANGKSIIISNQALSKGRKVLTEAEDSSTEKLHTFIDSSLLLCKEKENTGVYDSDKENGSFIVDSVPYSITTEVNNEKQKNQAKFEGFKTARGNLVPASHEALDVAMKDFKASDDLDISDKPLLIGFQTAKGTHVKVSTKALEIAKKCLKDTEDDYKLHTEDIGYSNTYKSNGFQTAGGTDIEVGAKTLEMTKCSLKDVDKTDDTDSSSKPVFDEILALEGKSPKDGDDIGVFHKPQFIELESASGACVELSDKAVENMNHSVKDTGDLAMPSKGTNDMAISSMSNGFQAASETHVKGSDKALEMARNTLKDNEDLVVPAKPVVDGFQTASGRQVKVTDKALEMARNTLKDDEHLVVPAKDNNDLVPSKPVSDGFQTASGINVKVSDKALEMARNTLKDNEDLVVPAKPAFDGFQTASGINVKVSDKALEMARNTLKDDEDLVVPSKLVFNGFQTANGTHVKVTDKALEIARNTLKDKEDLIVPAKPVFNGFQTASGTHVKVSHKALELARNTLKDNKDLVVPAKPVFNGFQTASGTHVNVSHKALEMARNTLKDNEDLVVPAKPAFNGFQTASGTHVNVSHKALELARNTLKDNEDLVVPAKPAFNGFQTASGTHVKVSHKALEMARNTLKDDEDSDISSKTVFNGFQTASGTHVKVSDKALEMARSSLEDADKSDLTDCLSKPVFNGFQTASGTNVNVSKKALEMARNSLKDTDIVAGQDSDLQDSHRHQDTYMRMPQHKPQEVHMEGNTSKYTIQESLNLSEGRKACVSADLEDELPYKRQKLGHGEEKGITRLAGMKPDMLVKRKPLCSAPEGTTTDRRHPGFRPFKPVCSRNIEKQTQRKDESSSTTLAITECKSSFQTPYKKADQSKVTSDVYQESKDEINMKAPVFQSKSKSSVNTSVSNFACTDTVVTGGNNFHVQTACDKHDDRCDSVTHGTIQNSRSFVCDKDGMPSVCTGTKQFEVSPKMQVQINDNASNYDQSDVKLSCNKADVSMETNDLGSISQDEDDMFFCNLVEARRQQDEIINSRKTKKVEPVMGRWYQSKTTCLGDRLELRDVVTRHFNKPMGKPILVTSLTAEEYRFSLVDHYGKHTAHVLLGDGAFLVPDDEGKAGKKEFYRAFLTMEGVDPKLMNEAWVFNHYRWIVWKLAAYEVTCASLVGRSLTPENVMLQIKYRYDREIDRSERSCLKRIYERDDAASKSLVLCVSSIRFDTKLSSSEPRSTVKQECMKVDIELTDGWYKVPAQLDGPLTTMVHDGKILVGQKLCISGAELVGSEDACLPLEAPSSIHLKININSTRLAAWDSPLGYQKDPRPLCVPLVSLFDEGGTVGVIDVVLVRKYPIMYMEKLSGGGCVFRSSRDEEREQQRYQTKRQIEIEKLYNQIQVDIENEQRQDKRQKRGCKKYSNSEIEVMMTGDEIHEAMENAARPDMVENYLSATQQGLLYEYQRRLQDEKQQELNMRVQSALRDKEEEAPTERNVTPVLKFRIAGCSNKDLDSQTTTILTVWRPAAEISELQEGKRYKIYSLNTSSARSKYIGSSVQVTATKQTKFMHFNIDENLLDRIYEPREVLWVNDIKRRQAPYGELDFVGYIVKKVSAEMKNSVRSPDVLYIADCQSNILSVKFWNGFKMFGEDTLSEGTCVCMSNLMDKSSYRNKTLPAVEATTEFTTITLKPQNSRQRQALEKLRTVIKSKDTFKDDVLTTLDDLLHNRCSARTPEKLHKQAQAEFPNQSPVKAQDKTVPSTGIEHIIQKDKGQLQVADTHNKDISDIAKHLDESFTATPSSQSRSKNTQSRLAKLAAYGTPDCISPLPVAVPRSVSKSFKPPAFRKKLN